MCHSVSSDTSEDDLDWGNAELILGQHLVVAGVNVIEVASHGVGLHARLALHGRSERCLHCLGVGQLGVHGAIMRSVVEAGVSVLLSVVVVAGILVGGDLSGGALGDGRPLGMDCSILRDVVESTMHMLVPVIMVTGVLVSGGLSLDAFGH